jgi:predicted MFS family arabinose efflux permease
VLATAGGLAVGLAAGWNIANTGAIARPLADAYGVSLAAVGLLTTALFVTHFGAQLPGGRAIDRIGARRAGLASIVVILCGNAVALLSTSFGLALVARLLTGIGTGTGFVAGSDYVRSAGGTPTAQGLYGGASIAGGGLAIAIVPLLDAPLGWRAAYWTALVVAAALAIVLAAAPADERHPAQAQSTPLAGVVKDRGLYPLAVLHTASFGLSVIAGNWIVDLLENDGYSRRIGGLVGGLVLQLGLITRPLGGWVSRTQPYRSAALLVASIVAGSLALAVLATPAPLGLLAAAAAVAGLAAGVPFATAFAGAQRRRPDAPAAAIGLVNAAATVTIVVGTPLVGLTFSLVGHGRIGFGILAALWLGALAAVRSVARA